MKVKTICVEKISIRFYLKNILSSAGSISRILYIVLIIKSGRFMIIYIITTTVKNEYEKEWLQWVKEKRIPEIINTGYFKSYRMYKIKIPTNLEGEVTYVVQYECESMKGYTAYAEKDSKRLQAEYPSKFIGKVTTSRTVLESI
jgi:hypothetical protein